MFPFSASGGEHMKKQLIATVAAIALAATGSASAHNAVNIKEAYAGYSTPMELSVNHGCKASPVIGLRLKVPDGVTDAKAAFDPNWSIEYKYRTLETPINMHGRMISEVVDEIIWKDPVKVLPADGWYPFRLRMTIPDTPNEIMHIRNITVCEEGTDPYVDMPDQELSIFDPNFAESAWAFMTATRGPAPFIVIRAPAKKQNAWEWTPEQARAGAMEQEASAK